MFKVTIIGAGNVGATAGQYITMKNLADVVLMDINKGAAAGKALDLQETGPLTLQASNLSGAESYQCTADSDIVVITAGVPRKEGMSRDDLLKINAQIVQTAASEAIKYSPDAIFIVVTNPLDVITQLVYQVTGLPRERVIGMAGVLDSARLQTFLALEVGVSAADVKAMVLGGHGDLMVPLTEQASISGIPVTQLISAERLSEIAIRTRDGGAEIVKLLGNGSAYYAPGASVALMVEAILRDEFRLMPCSVMTSGQYGIHDTFVGLPVVLGAGGVERIIELDLSAPTLAALQKSAASIKSNVDTMNKLIGWQAAPEVVPVTATAPAHCCASKVAEPAANSTDTPDSANAAATPPDTAVKEQAVTENALSNSKSEK